MRSPSLSGGDPLTTLGENAEERNRFANATVETRSSDPASVAVVMTQESVKSESRHTLSVLQRNDGRLLLVATTHDQAFGSFIGDLDAKSIRESQRFVDERLTSHVRSVTLWQAHRTNKNNMQTESVAKMTTLE